MSLYMRVRTFVLLRCRGSTTYTQKRPSISIKRDVSLLKETYYEYQKRPSITVKRDMVSVQRMHQIHPVFEVLLHRRDSNPKKLD
jgi:hypothetical protein